MLLGGNAMNRLLSLAAALMVILGVSASAVEQPQPNREQQPAESSEVRLYDPDPNHLWNRLHHALHVRLTELGNPEKEQPLLPGDQSYHALELDACLWPDRSTYLRLGEPHKMALVVLDEFLAKDG